MAVNPADLKIQLQEIESKYNSMLELLQLIAGEKGDEAASDPDYIQYYSDASSLNEQFEALQARLVAIEQEGVASPVPELDVAIDVEEPLDVHVAAPVPETESTIPDVVDPGTGTGDAKPAPEPVSILPSDGDAGGANESVVPGETGAPAVVAVEVVESPPEPKHVTVERTRVEVERVHEQSWSFVGISSNVVPAISDLAGKGGYVTENILEKQFGPVTFVLPFPLDSPVGLMVSQVNKRAGKNAGMIVYPIDSLTMQGITIMNQILQALLASRAPKNHVVVLVKPVRSPVQTDKISVIMGGLTDQDARLKQSLEAKLGQDKVYFDNDIFYKGQLLEEIKAFTGKIGLRLVTMVCTAPLLQSLDQLQALIESF